MTKETIDRNVIYNGKKNLFHIHSLYLDMLNAPSCSICFLLEVCSMLSIFIKTEMVLQLFIRTDNIKFHSAVLKLKHRQLGPPQPTFRSYTLYKECIKRNKKFWEELITYFPLIQHGLNRKWCLQQFSIVIGTCLPSQSLTMIGDTQKNPQTLLW
jgi:hypothetical protein